MVRRILIPAVFIFCAMLCAPAEQLPSSDSEESFEIEPPLLIPYRPPGTNKMAEPEPAAPPPTVTELTKSLERAKRNAIGAERLYRMGALSRVESEQKALRVVRLEAELESARLAEVKQQANQADMGRDPASVVQQPSPTQQMDSSKDAELAKAIETAHAALKKREAAELAAAETDLERQRKLLSLGIGRKSSVAKAERKLAELKAGRN